MSKQGVVNIRGKEYKTVALRVTEFRNDHPDWAIETDIIDDDNDVVLMRAVIRDASGRAIASGHAEENRSKGQINSTSAIENCETSAIGRALACAGYAGQEFASADEVASAVAQQGAKKPPAKKTPTKSAKDIEEAMKADAQMDETTDAIKQSWDVAMTPEDLEARYKKCENVIKNLSDNHQIAVKDAYRERLKAIKAGLI
jgi:hypothetical protein